jgi:gas vesicle protein
MSDNGVGYGGMTCFVLGALVGAGVALMYAPYSGKETRRLLGRKVTEMKNMSARGFEDVRDTVSREAKSMRSDVKETTNAQGMPQYAGAGSNNRA